MNKKIMILIIGLLIGTMSSALALSFLSTNIGYTPKDKTWKVKNVDEALNDLYENGKTEKNLVIYLDNKKIQNLPNKDDGYVIEKIVCKDNAKIFFDTDKYEISISNISTTKTSCSVHFTTTSLTELVSQNINNEDKLSEIFAIPENIKGILSANNENLLIQLFEKQMFRNLIYDNYKLTESVIANSQTALNAMKKTTRYQVIGKSTGQYKTFYEDKAFVLGFSCAGGSSGNYTIGRFLSTGESSWNPSGYYSTTGLSFPVNKFASSVYVNGIMGGSFQWESAMYAAIFKI